MEKKYENVRANLYVKTDGELRVTNAKEEVKRLREVTKNWSNGAAMTAINEELHHAESLEKRVELLQFKSDVLEHSTFGRTYAIHED